MLLKRKPFCLYFGICLIIGLASSGASAWGPQGHRVAGTLTWQQLPADTRSRIRELIGDQSLADASTWADRMRDNPSPFWQQQAGPYHYVTVPPGRTYDEVGAPEQGDAMTALANFRAILADPAAPLVQKQLALRFSLHIIQDLHQPMHVGNGRDRGGNRVRLTLRGKRTNLHRVWDSAILGHANRSDADWIDQLSGAGERQFDRGADTDPRVWIAESAELRERVYPTGNSIGSDYLDAWLPAVQQRLQASAVRGAAWLDNVLMGQDQSTTTWSSGSAGLYRSSACILAFTELWICAPGGILRRRERLNFQKPV